MPEAALAGGATPPRIVDLWRMAQAGPAADEQALVVGVTRGEDAKALLGLPRDETQEFDRGDGFIHVVDGETFIELDPAGRLSGLGFGDYLIGSRISTAVETAVARLDGLGDPISAANLKLGDGGVWLRFNGHDASVFATLPRFIEVSKEIQGFELSAWPDDKTVTLIRKTEHGALHAQFALKAFKTEQTEHFQIDYCLSWIAFFTTASQSRWTQS
jgi:hypothetical protein